MLLNVWGSIWPNNKRILAATAGTGPAAPPELARQAFFASRTNAWLLLPMLLFMGTSHGEWGIFGEYSESRRRAKPETRSYSRSKNSKRHEPQYIAYSY